MCFIHRSYNALITNGVHHLAVSILEVKSRAEYSNGRRRASLHLNSLLLRVEAVDSGL